MSFWKKLGKGLKIAAPFAAMAIPGLGPVASMALGAGLGAGGSLLEGDGLGQTMLAGSLGAAGGATKLKAGGVSGAVKNIAGKVTGIKGQGGDQQGGGWGDLIADTAATAIGAYGKSSAENRGAQLSATVDQHGQDISAEDSFQRQLMARAAEDRAGQNNAWKQLQQAGYVAGRPDAAPVTGFSPYTRDVPMPSADVVAGAKALVEQNRDSLMAGRYNTNGGAPLPMPTRVNTGLPEDLMKPGMGERIADVAGPAMGMWEMLRRKQKAPVLTTQAA